MTNAAHPVDRGLPAGRLLLLGLQHMAIMYTGCIAVPLVIGSALHLDNASIALLVNADLFVAGLATLVQSVGIGRLFGVRLPVVAGATFTVVNPMILIAAQYGITAVYGAMIASGVFGLLIARPFAALIRFFPPLVSGTLLLVIGISLLGPGTAMIGGHDTGDPSYGDPANLGLAFGVIALVVLFTRVLRGFLGQIGPLVALIAACPDRDSARPHALLRRRRRELVRAGLAIPLRSTDVPGRRRGVDVRGDAGVVHRNDR